MSDGNGHVSGIKTITIEWTKNSTGGWKPNEVPGTEKVHGGGRGAGDGSDNYIYL